MERPCVTINTPMLASAIGIDAGLKSNVRAVVVVDDGLALILIELFKAVVFYDNETSSKSNDKFPQAAIKKAAKKRSLVA